jgi:hypothetical protein
MNNAESFLARNLAVLRTVHPPIAETLQGARYDSNPFKRQSAKNGLPVLEVTREGKRVHLGSRTDPRLEASRLARALLDGTEHLIVLLGIGMGYLLEEMHKLNPDARVLVIEPDVGLFTEILKTRDLSASLGAGRTELLLEPGTIEFDDLIPSDSAGNLRLIVSRPYRALFQERIGRIERDFQTYLNGKRINIATLERFDRLWTKNIFKNCTHFFTRPGVEMLRHSGREFPAVIVAAGPSQETQLPLLRHLQEGLILIAVDTVAEPLMKRHIIPDFIVTVDPQYINSRYVARLETLCERSALPVLVADPAVYPAVLRTYGGPVILTSSVFSPGKVIERFSGVKGSIAAGGSVATASFDLGRILDAEPLFMLGLDLAYEMGRTHLSGSLVEHYFLTRSTRFCTLPSLTAGYMRGGDAVPVKGRGEKTVFTDRRMLLYRTWFEHQMRTEKRKVKNATAGGLPVEGMADEPLESLRKHVSRDTAAKKVFMRGIRSAIEAAPANLEGMARFVRYLDDTMEELNLFRQTGARAMEETEILLQSPSEGRWEELGALDSRLLSFKEPNRLISMVMQASIHQVLSRQRAKDLKETLDVSRGLYAAMCEAADYIRGLMKISRELLDRHNA